MPQTDLLFITQLALRSREGTTRLLDAFDRVPELAPTHWGPDERARNPFARDDIISFVLELTDDVHMPGLRRQLAPRWSGFFSARAKGLNMVKLSFAGALRSAQAERVFALGDALAAALEPELGLVGMVEKGAGLEYEGATRIVPRLLQRYGPVAIATRTWLGPHLVQLIGRERLAAAPVSVTPVPWGGVRIDLIDRPWAHAISELVARHTAAMEVLRPSGVFGEYAGDEERQGPNWIPIPERPRAASV